MSTLTVVPLVDTPTSSTSLVEAIMRTVYSYEQSLAAAIGSLELAKIRLVAEQDALEDNK